MAPNIYEHLDRLDDDVVNDPGTNERRKAEKKLKEIQTLRKKTSHTKEELNKLATEQQWKDIIDWFDKPKKAAEKTTTKPEETQKTIKNRLKRKREDEKREREIEEILKRQQEEFRKEEYRKQEQKRQQEEYRKQEQKRQQEEFRKEEFRKQEQKRQEEEFRKEEFRKQHYEHQDLWSEFEALFHKNNDVNKTFRKLSMKYHPDKNIGKKQWAEAKQKELTNIRDDYSKGV